MNDVYLVTMLRVSKRGATYRIFRFVAGTDESRANYLAGCCLDALADYHGKKLRFDYRVEPLPYVAAMTAEIEIVKRALESAA